MLPATFALYLSLFPAAAPAGGGAVDPSTIADLYRHSLAVAEETRQKVPGTSKPTFDLGRVHQRFGHDEEAVKLYREGLRMDPRHPEVLSRIGFMLSQSGRSSMDEALEAYREALRWDPQIENVHTRIGLILVHQGRHAEAVEEFRAEIHNRTADSLTYTVLGHALRDLKRFPQALQSYQEALRLNPEERGAHYGLAQVYQLLGRTGEEAAAREEFKRLKAREDQDSKEALIRGGNRPEELRRAALTYLDAAGTYLEAEKLDEAERCARAAVSFDPELEAAQRLLLDLFRRAGRADEAIAFAREVLAGKRTPRMLYHLAGLVLARGSAAEAAGLLEEAIRLG
ncbi:MAG: tetratricopeptide repeat protein, partial [Thermoanaerobaculia bacterium]